MTGDLITDGAMILCHKAGHPARVGEIVGEETIVGGAAPRRAPSSGRVHLASPESHWGYRELYPSVVDCFWRKMRPREIAAHVDITTATRIDL